MPVGVALSDDHKAAILALVRDGRAVRTAAAMVHFTWPTVKRHLETDHEFRESLAEAEHFAVAQIEDKLYEEAKDGNLGAIKFYLGNRAANRWTDERGRGPAPGGAGSANPEVLVAAVREVLTDGSTREATVAMLTKVPLPERAEAIEASSTESN